ncbi:MAG: phosphoserine aminotransferase, partial [Deltaproteobacteria bacterium]
VVSDRVKALPKEERAKFLKEIASEMGKRKAAYDMGSYKDAPVGFRIWCGPTIEQSDVVCVLNALERTFNDMVKEI